MYFQFIKFSLTRKGNKKQINNEYCYEFVDRLKSLELKYFLHWFLFPETKIIFENYKTASFYHYYFCERFEPRSHVKSRLSLIVGVNVVLNRNVVVDSDWRFDNLCGSHLQSQSELYHVSWRYYALVIDLIGQLRRDVIGRLPVKLWCYWLWRLVISNWCVSIRLLSQLNSRLLLVKLSVPQSFSRS